MVVAFLRCDGPANTSRMSLAAGGGTKENRNMNITISMSNFHNHGNAKTFSIPVQEADARAHHAACTCAPGARVAARQCAPS